MENEEIECLDLGALFTYLGRYQSNGSVVQTCYDHVIRREPYGNDYYYDLYRTVNSNMRLCCDGEQVKVLERTDQYVKLIDVENIDDEDLEEIDTTFKLETNEFNIATHRPIITGEE
ncbi:MAG: hypothetical protein J6Y69_10250 [Treponema sp.]|nr:hypothetical protein [Treponema sp.]